MARAQSHARARLQSSRPSWAVPEDLQSFQAAKISLIPSSSAAAAVLTLYVCPSPVTLAGNVASSLTLGPGSYVFLASLRLLGGLLDDRKFVSMNYATTLTAASTVVELYCHIRAGPDGSADAVTFTAIKVQTATTQ